MQLAGDVTRQDIVDIIESYMDSKFWNHCSRWNVDVKVNVANNLRPSFTVDTHEDSYTMTVTTVDLTNDDNEEIGWGFDVTVTCTGFEYTLLEAMDIARMMDKATAYEAYSSIASMIAQAEIFPMDYLD